MRITTRHGITDLICDEGFDTVVCGTAAEAMAQAEVGSFPSLSMWVYDRERHVFLEVNDAALVNLATHAKNFFR